MGNKESRKRRKMKAGSRKSFYCILPMEIFLVLVEVQYRIAHKLT